jgi:hypothetical protein
MKLKGKELKQARLYASVASENESYLKEDLYRKLEDWKEIIERLKINEESYCPAGGKYYFFEKPFYLKQFNTNLEALTYLVFKLNGVYNYISNKGKNYIKIT